MTEFWIVLISAIIGTIFSVANVWSAYLDRRALEQVGADEAARTVGTYLATTEAVRLGQQILLVLIAALVLSLSFLPASIQRNTAKIVVWTFVLHCILLSVNTAISWSYRKRVRDQFIPPNDHPKEK